MKTKLLAATLASLLVGGFAATSPAFGEETVGKKIDDAALVTKIKANLLSAKDVDGLDVNVDAKNGVVTLSGTATTEAERANAVRIARNADGVKSVDNRIMIKGKTLDHTGTPKTTTPPATTP
jgi:hyperosmotically inducible periplasmic protein